MDARLTAISPIPIESGDKNWQNLPISNTKPDLHYINVYTKYGENLLIFTQVIIRKRKYGQMDIHRTDFQRETITPCHHRVAGNKNRDIIDIYLFVPSS